MISAWTIGINIIARSNAGGVFGKMGGQATAAESKVSKLQNGISRMPGVARAASLAFDGLAIGAAASLAIGIKGAANLQDAMIQVQLATKMSNREMERMVPLAMKMSMATAQSLPQSMEILRTMAMSGINKPNELRDIAMPIARFADTQYLGKNHVEFNDSAALAAKVAHMMGARTAKDLTPILDQLYRMSNDMPDSLKLAANQLKQFAPFFKAAKVPTQTILNLQATADRMGMGGGYGGTGLAQLLNVIQDAPSKKSFVAQRQLGLLDSAGGSRFIDRKTNKFDPLSLFEFINSKRHDAKFERDFTSMLNRAMSSQSARRVMKLFSSDAGLAQYRSVVAQQHGMANVEQAQVKLMSSLNSQTKLLTSNFNSLATIIGMPFIEPLTRLVSNTANLIGNLATYFQQHPAAGGVASAAVGVASVYGAYKLFRMIGGIGAFVHFAAHHAKDAANVGGGVYMRMGHGAEAARNARLGVVAGDAVGNGFFSGIMRFASPLTKVIGTLASKFMGPLGIVSSVLLFGDAVKLLQNHSFDIGKALGKATAWIVSTGGPSLSKAITDAFVNAIANLIPAIGKALVGITDRISDIVVESPGKLIDAAVRGVKGFNTGRYGIDPHRVGSAPLGPRLPMAPRIGPLPHGGVPNPGFGLHLPAPVVNHFHFHAAAGTNDATSRRQAMVHGREVAKQVANVMGQVGRTATRAAGQTIASARMSSFETTSSYS